VPFGWNDEQFCFAVEILETVNRRTLFELLTEFKIRFDEKVEKFLEDDDLISALLDDAPKEQLLGRLRKIVRQKPYGPRRTHRTAGV
jgi:hypothetical protein